MVQKGAFLLSTIALKIIAGTLPPSTLFIGELSSLPIHTAMMSPPA